MKGKLLLHWGGTVVQPDRLAQIPDKTYFKIGEVCDITSIKSHTLRYWESEFSMIRPRRAGSNQRLYRKVDVENILKIKALIYERGMTIAGVKKMLAQSKQEKKKAPLGAVQLINILPKIKEELLAIQKLLS